MRKVILHYHLFKNAGTSLDAVLKANFPGRWVTGEFTAARHDANTAEVARWIEREDTAVAFSSHTALLPPPQLSGVECFPIVFVRHPIDRIASAYAFERAQEGATFGSTLARNTSLAGYIEVRLARPLDRQCRNFQVGRLAQMLRGAERDEAARALRTLDGPLFVGLVERFDASVERLAGWLSPHFPGFGAVPVAQNVARDRTVPLEQRLERIRAEIGADRYALLMEANAADIAVFDAVQKRYKT